MTSQLIRNRHLLLGLVVLLVSASCQSHAEIQEEAEAAPDRMAFDRAFGRFAEAYDELGEACKATPGWHTDAKAAVRVEGQADLAKARLDELLRHVATGLISQGTIDLARMEVDRVADPNLPTLGGALPTEDPGVQLNAAQDELAWWRMAAELPHLERYVADHIDSPWLDSYVIPRARQDILRLRSVTSESRTFWKTAPQDTDFDEGEVRMVRVLQGLNNWTSTPAP